MQIGTVDLRVTGLRQLGLPFDPGPGARDSGSGTWDSGSGHRGSGSETRDSGQSNSAVASPLVEFVRVGRARHYRLRVTPDGGVRVTIPRGGSRREATAFAAKHRDWIERQRKTLLADALPDEGERRSLIARARQELPARLRDLASAHNLVVSRVTIRNQQSRWGSCGRNGHICLNWRLIRMPDWVRDYVMLHELMHLRRMDHSPLYWKLLAEACPDYQSARTWLLTHGRTL